MLQSISLITPLLIALAHAGDPLCTGDKVADVNRIEYQIPLDHRTLQGDVRGNTDEFMEYLDEVIEDNLYYNVIDIKKDKTKEWLRTDRTREVTFVTRPLTDIPGSSSIKLRHCVPTDWHVNDPDIHQYQNDLTFAMNYHVPGCTKVYGATKDYEAVAKRKVEPNVFPDPCCFCNEAEGMDIIGDPSSVGVAVKLEFDDVKDADQWGSDCTDAKEMVSEAEFLAWPFECETSGLGNYFDGMCDLYRDADPADFTIFDKSVYNYVLQVKFEINYQEEDGTWIEVSEGKFVFQVRFDTWEKWEAQRPTGRETEMSVKAYKDKTEEGYWPYVVDTLSKVTDTISNCGHPWIRYDSCIRDGNPAPPECPTRRPTMSPTHSPGYIPPQEVCACESKTDKKRWVTKCAGFDTEALCGKSRRIRNNCLWGCA